jgi:hypothetical protein
LRDLSLHLLDIAENSVTAGAGFIDIAIIENSAADRLLIRVEDDGKGIDLVKKDNNSYYTEKKGKRFGLGIPLLKQAARECDGGFRIAHRSSGGTRVEAEFRLSHIDLKPLGDMGSTLVALIAGHPELDCRLVYDKDGSSYELDTRELKKELEGVPVDLPAVLKLIREDVNQGIRRIKG